MLEIWCDITNFPTNETSNVSGLLTHAPVHYVVACPEQVSQLQDLHGQDRIKVVTLASSPEQIAWAAENCDVIVVPKPSLVNKARKTGKSVGLWHSVNDGESLKKCRESIGLVDYLIVGFRDETNIPLELLLAAAQGTQTQVVKQVNNRMDALITHGVLESGPRGVMFAIDSLSDAGTLTEDLLKVQTQQLPLREATVISARHVGMGYRGCIDTTSLFDEDEGMIIGSTSSGGLLVCAEVHYLPYMNLRPFRVNAGAVHSYVWANGATEYITDLEGGSTVLGVSSSGRARPVIVGRVKTEIRPLRLIVAEADGVRVNLFLQDDWHVRIFDADMKVRNCTSIKAGDKVLSYVCEPGRHVGIKVAESIEER